ncbi:SusC/RagA family TonB-linked outer membrane protein [Mucilaginibacter terrae]|uniref:TonB-linked SusC/RagA family outer membrane protein n=1 Tax=Mucilaginibacter terrae TaxID=1955052 RepID=A0ABU3GR01_9SPHI|nr:TonB-dependent receptor [Mucilaginibacter terrae]MDT3402210.1 TonB-linked SusC/RagA family outer membrane protein [Mucilaginibacter terrae]
MVRRKLLFNCRGKGAAIFWLLFTLCYAQVFAGVTKSVAAFNISIKGKVVDDQGEILAGVTVMVKGTRIGAATNVQGEYRINSVPENGTLVFSLIGFKTLEVPVKNQKTINVTMVPDRGSLDDVVVIGYGTIKKSNLTGAVAKLKTERLDELPTSRLDNALIGKLAGLTVQINSSEAGSEPTLRIRGASSVSANASPLVVIDGHPIEDGLAYVSPQDVESLEVLKDAASSAIYGSRGANGVILVTTKKGVADKPRYSIKSYYGIKEAYKLHPIMNTTEYTQLLFDEARQRANDPSIPAASQNLITANERAAYIIENQITGVATDWQKAAMRNASIYNIQASVSGGKKDLRYYVSGNVQQDQGIMKYSENRRGNFKVNVDANLSSKLSLNVSLNPTYTKTQTPAVNFTDYYRFLSFIPVNHTDFSSAFVNQNAQWAGVRAGDFAQARHFTNLVYAGTMPDGSFYTSPGTVAPFSSTANTPISIADRENRFAIFYRMQGSTDLSYRFNKALVFKSAVSGYYRSVENATLTKSNARRDGDVNSGSILTTRTIDLLWENTLNYSKSFKKHSFSGLLGYTVQKTNTDVSSIVGSNSPSDNFTTLAQASVIDQLQTYTTKTPVGLLSYLGRINYDYASKYLFSASLRADESSKFRVGNRTGWFPAVSAGWVMSNEKFMEKTNNWLSSLKARASYGVTGNNRIADFSYLDLLYKATYSFGEGTGTVQQGQAPNNPVTFGPDITWETTNSTDIGLDMSFLKNKFTLTLDYYNSRTNKLLLQQGTQSITGSNVFYNNNGSIKNEGFEAEFSSTNINSKKFIWTTSANISVNRNKLLKLGGEPYQYNYGERNEIYASIVGRPYVQFLGYQSDGVWQSQTEVDAALASGQTAILQSYFQPGGLKLKDVNGDNRIDINDRTVIGNPFPDFTWGVTNTFRYKGIDLTLIMQGSQGGKLINGDLFYNESKKLNRNFTDGRWVSPTNPGDGKTPYFTNGIAADLLLTDYAVEDASYAFLRNIIVGYTVPQKWLKKVGFKAVRIYTAADNVFFVTGKSYRGINPEARMVSSAYASPVVSGYQRGGFPVNRTITFGLDVNF